MRMTAKQFFYATLFTFCVGISMGVMGGLLGGIADSRTGDQDRTGTAFGILLGVVIGVIIGGCCWRNFASPDDERQSIASGGVSQSIFTEVPQSAADRKDVDLESQSQNYGTLTPTLTGETG